MNESVGSAIEKIKLLEQDNENKLKEKREHDAMVSTLNKSIKESVQQTEKLQYEFAHLIKRIDILRSELIVERTRRDALVVQVGVCKKELEDLRNQSDQGIAKVWELRSEMCCSVQTVADQCDIRALLIKPMKPEIHPLTSIKKHAGENSPEISENEERLKAALERRNKAVAERDRLQTEPDEGEEYIRIKNALKYSLDMISKMRKFNDETKESIY